jgi:signal recognition particle subunit SRP72
MAAATKSLTALLAQTTINDHEETLQAANAAIKKSKTDTQAHHVRAVALLYLDRFEDALKVFEGAEELQGKARFEYAYTLYKTGNAAKAVEVASAGTDDTGRGMKHVLAQAVSPGRSCVDEEGDTDDSRQPGSRGRRI